MCTHAVVCVCVCICACIVRAGLDAHNWYAIFQEPILSEGLLGVSLLPWALLWEDL